MNNETLYHHGVKGMKWGVRRYQNKDGTLTAAGKKKKFVKNKTSSKKSPKKMTAEELKDRIERLELEKKYKDVYKSARTSKGHEFVMDVLEKSGKNIATQFTTYWMGTAVNKTFKSEIVNPRKGQKDK